MSATIIADSIILVAVDPHQLRAQARQLHQQARQLDRTATQIELAAEYTRIVQSFELWQEQHTDDFAPFDEFPEFRRMCDLETELGI